jgi:hypothetical protein
LRRTTKNVSRLIEEKTGSFRRALFATTQGGLRYDVAAPERDRRVGGQPLDLMIHFRRDILQIFVVAGQQPGNPG